MKLIALLIGLAVERLATQLFHLRELRWLDYVIDAGCAQVTRFGNWPAIIPVALLAVLLAAPVFIVTFMLGDLLFGFPYLLLAIVVLFFSLGPRDIGEEVDEYCAALESGDAERIRASSKALLEHDVPDDPAQRIAEVEQAVFVQANNRLFAVIFWFVLLGPLGALGLPGDRPDTAACRLQRASRRQCRIQRATRGERRIPAPWLAGLDSGAADRARLCARRQFRRGAGRVAQRTARAAGDDRREKRKAAGAHRQRGAGAAARRGRRAGRPRHTRRRRCQQARVPPAVSGGPWSSPR
ncbi:MAG: regulatory signaling modulator protein AmpE [Woeseiaceae bacterium]|nr:regulatory signaling modulator protein AmpE [Woeseiaceae bacterium]